MSRKAIHYNHHLYAQVAKPLKAWIKLPNAVRHIGSPHVGHSTAWPYCVDPPRPRCAPLRKCGKMIGSRCVPLAAATFGPTRAPDRPPFTVVWSPPALRIVAVVPLGNVVRPLLRVPALPPLLFPKAPPPLVPWKVVARPPLWASPLPPPPPPLKPRPAADLLARCARLPPRAMLLSLLELSWLCCPVYASIRVGVMQSLACLGLAQPGLIEVHRHAIRRRQHLWRLRVCA